MSLAACSSESRAGVTTPPDGGAAGDLPPVVMPVDDSGTGAPATGGEVFGQSDTTLYRLDPTTKEVKVVGNFDGCFSAAGIRFSGASRSICQPAY